MVEYKKMKKPTLIIVTIFLGIFSVACGGLDVSEQPGVETAAVEQTKVKPGETAVSGKFTPPNGQTLFIIGQDYDTVTEYTEAVPSPVPGGVTSYTSLNRLEGIEEVANNGSGNVHLDALAEKYPQSIIAIGLYLVDYLNVINSGNADAKIDWFLDHLAAYERPVFLRFGYEFDGTWNHYDSEAYKEAWIYFYNKMQEKSIDNVAMVWQSATYCGGTHQGKPIDAWYPGDEYVDWVGISYFVQQDCDLEPIEEAVAFAREHNKPVISAETAPQRYETGKLTYSTNGSTYEDKTAEQIWDEWYAPFFSYVDENGDVIRAVAYINTYWDSQGMWGPPHSNGYWGDSRVQANDLILENWQTELAIDKWLHGSEALFETLGYE